MLANGTFWRRASFSRSTSMVLVGRVYLRLVSTIGDGVVDQNLGSGCHDDVVSLPSHCWKIVLRKYCMASKT